MTDSTTSPIGTVLLGEHLGDLAPDHHADDVVAGHVASRRGCRCTAVAEHRELVGDLEQLVHLVGDVDDAFALRPQVADDLEQMRDLASRSAPRSARP